MTPQMTLEICCVSVRLKRRPSIVGLLASCTYLVFERWYATGWYYWLIQVGLYGSPTPSWILNIPAPECTAYKFAQIIKGAYVVHQIEVCDSGNWQKTRIQYFFPDNDKRASIWIASPGSRSTHTSAPVQEKTETKKVNHGKCALSDLDMH